MFLFSLFTAISKETAAVGRLLFPHVSLLYLIIKKGKKNTSGMLNRCPPLPAQTILSSASPRFSNQSNIRPSQTPTISAPYPSNPTCPFFPFFRHRDINTPGRPSYLMHPSILPSVLNDISLHVLKNRDGRNGVRWLVFPFFPCKDTDLCVSNLCEDLYCGRGLDSWASTRTGLGIQIQEVCGARYCLC